MFDLRSHDSVFDVKQEYILGNNPRMSEELICLYSNFFFQVRFANYVVKLHNYFDELTKPHLRSPV